MHFQSPGSVTSPPYAPYHQQFALHMGISVTHLQRPVVPIISLQIHYPTGRSAVLISLEFAIFSALTHLPKPQLHRRDIYIRSPQVHDPLFTQPSCAVSSPAYNRLVDLVVNASASRAEDPGFKSRLRRDFSGVESYQ